MKLIEDQKKLALDLKEALLGAYDIEALILFGSLGRGDADEFSDIDLLVMETDRERAELSGEMAEYLRPYTLDIHVIVRTPQEFCRQGDIPGTLDYSAHREGRILFDKGDWRARNLPFESYETRKLEVIRREYAGSARDFMDRAESSLRKGNLFRCRDFCRFAALRAVKGIFVKYDIHPPRETDLIKLFHEVRELEPGLDQEIGFLRELNSFRPGDTGAMMTMICGDLLEKTREFTKRVTGRYDQFQEQDLQGSVKVL
jgi:predicted nucleotidyltransferase/HEPN domain-containing protein